MAARRRKTRVGDRGHVLMEVFPATLGSRERLITYGVGYGVGIGVPTILAVAFAVGFGEPLLLLFPLPFAIAYGGLPYVFRPTGFGVTSEEVSVLRAIGARRFPIGGIRHVAVPASNPQGSVVGIARVQGIHGSFGSFWNKEWGRFRAYVTNPANTVEIGMEDGSRVIVSPDDPVGFVEAVRRRCAEAGGRLPVEGT